MKFKAFGTGRLGKDAEVTNFENGRSVIEFSAASNSYYKNKEGEKITDTEWYDVKIFVKTVNQSFVDKLKKGVHVVVTGNLESNEWEKDGIKRKDTYINANSRDVRVLSTQPSETEEAESVEAEEVN